MDKVYSSSKFEGSWAIQGVLKLSVAEVLKDRHNDRHMKGEKGRGLTRSFDISSYTHRNLKKK